ncbi:MAG: branched-chain amino acid transaminase [Candidatus Acididesulfobacter guangdongensis]|uniref:Branched-chain-amino-acid aminotransferase n=1 Tax=Acididesulfobacter guangdongensis TaxID=2597225 RepID=A0A519BGQ0_ACIG2|nr:MAG: branched-chain amino acid transaminase [Candidatus Acididesulfobacter guangdongensis]
MAKTAAKAKKNSDVETVKTEGISPFNGSKVWMDGKFVDYSDANISVNSHSLHYGLGAFEGIRCYETSHGGSAVFRLKEHIDRLFNSSHILQITVPFSKEEIFNAVVELVKVNKFKECYIRPIVYIGDGGGLGIFIKEYDVKVSISAWVWGAYLGEEALRGGIRAKVSSYARFHVNTFMGMSKSTGQYINSILAKKEVVAAGYDEAIMLDTSGFVCEASGENIFIYSGGYIKTPPLSSVLPGITRDGAIEVIQNEMKIPVKEERITRDELYIADEVFLTGTAAEITPVREIDDRKIGKGKAGNVALELQDMFFKIVKGENKKYSKWLTKV